MKSDDKKPTDFSASDDILWVSPYMDPLEWVSTRTKKLIDRTEVQVAKSRQLQSQIGPHEI